MHTEILQINTCVPKLFNCERNSPKKKSECKLNTLFEQNCFFETPYISQAIKNNPISTESHFVPCN